MKKYFIGIDPGKAGAIVIWGSHTQTFEKYIFPLIGGKVLDLHAMSNFFEEFVLRCHLENSEMIAVLEDVHAIYGSGAGATFSFGHSVGVVEAMIVSYGIPYVRVQPKEWQNEMFKGVPIVRKYTDKKKKDGTPAIGPVDTKATALLAQKRLFPFFDARPTERSKNPHDGVVDAILMCEYCRRKYA